MKVLIIDDHPIARRGLSTVLSQSLGATDQREAGDGPAALELAAQFRPDLVLLDMHMPGPLPAPEICRKLRADLPGTTVVIVTAFETAKEIRECLAAGAHACLLKDTSELDMAAALRLAMAGEAVLDGRVAASLARGLANVPAPARGPGLTAREAEVLELLAQGCSNRSIAERLYLSEPTVKGYVSSLLAKLGAASRLEALVRASDAGLL